MLFRDRAKNDPTVVSSDTRESRGTDQYRALESEHDLSAPKLTSPIWMNGASGEVTPLEGGIIRGVDSVPSFHAVSNRISNNPLRGDILHHAWVKLSLLGSMFSGPVTIPGWVLLP